jgi:flagellar operon protein
MKIPELTGAVRPKNVAPYTGSRVAENKTEASFAKVLENKISQKSGLLKFSSHAIERLASRKIQLTVQDIGKIQNAVEKIEQKGGKESLVIMGNLAFVISVENNTVITAIDKNPNSEGKVFTNIDSALVL